jgi:hypothetical protein
MVRRTGAPMMMTRRMLLCTRGQDRRGNCELILHRFSDDKPEKKYYTKEKKRVYNGAVGYSDFRKHKNEERKQRYIDRHVKKYHDLIFFTLLHYLFKLVTYLLSFSLYQLEYL